MTTTTETVSLADQAAARGAEVAARRAARGLDLEASRRVEKARAEVPLATIEQRFLEVARLVVAAVDAHAQASGVRLDSEAPMGPSMLQIRVLATEERAPLLVMQRRDRALLVRVQGRSRSEEWSPRDLDIDNFDAGALAERIVLAWCSEVEPVHIREEVPA